MNEENPKKDRLFSSVNPSFSLGERRARAGKLSLPDEDFGFFFKKGLESLREKRSTNVSIGSDVHEVARRRKISLRYASEMGIIAAIAGIEAIEFSHGQLKIYWSGEKVQILHKEDGLSDEVDEWQGTP